jgi:hypothetical protein
MLHKLKIHPAYFAAVTDKTKQFEVRNNRGRDFQKGDTLELREFNPDQWNSSTLDSGVYTGRIVTADITYVTNFAQKEEFVVLGITLTSAISSWTVDE